MALLVEQFLSPDSTLLDSDDDDDAPEARDANGNRRTDDNDEDDDEDSNPGAQSDFDAYLAGDSSSSTAHSGPNVASPSLTPAEQAEFDAYLAETGD